jgi:hypothetical protein
MGNAQISIAQACAQAERLIAGNAPCREIFECLIAAAENMSGEGAVSSVLVLDERGLLRDGASPNLPSDYLRAIDGLKPDAAVGTCAAAAATGVVVITPSFLADDKWAELRHLPLSIGFAGAGACRSSLHATGECWVRSASTIATCASPLRRKSRP